MRKRRIAATIGAMALLTLAFKASRVDAADNVKQEKIQVYVELTALNYRVTSKNRVRSGGGDEQFNSGQDREKKAWTGSDPQFGIDYNQWRLEFSPSTIETLRLQTPSFSYGLFAQLENEQTNAESVWNQARDAADKHALELGPTAQFDFVLAPDMKLVMRGYILKNWRTERTENTDSNGLLINDDYTTYSDAVRVGIDLGAQYKLIDRLVLLSDLFYSTLHYTTDSKVWSQAENAIGTFSNNSTKGIKTFLSWRVFGIRVYL